MHLMMIMRRIKDPVSGWSHFVGVLFGILALVLLVYQSVVRGTPLHTFSFAVYGASLIILYAASTLYHMLPLGERGTLILRKLDHVAIYILIAGTYTPVCLLPLQGPWGWSLLGIIWGMTVAGISLKAFWMNAPPDGFPPSSMSLWAGWS
jgi:hemolysin III